MKPFIILLSFALTTTSLMAQNHLGQVLAESQGFQYTETHFQAGKRFVEFVLGQPLTAAEEQAGRQESIQDFYNNPVGSIQQTVQIDAQMQQVYQLTDPLQVALFRSAILCQLQTLFAQSQERPVIRQLIETHSPILAYDPANMLAFTTKDADGYLSLMTFYAQLNGQSAYIDEATRQQYHQYLTQAFLQGTVSDRQALSVMGVYSQYVQQAYAQLSANQQQDFTASYYQVVEEQPTTDYTNPDNLWPPGVNTTEEKQAYLAKRRSEISSFNAGMDVMSNVMLNQHVTTMNIIENIGGAGNYWEVTDYNY